MLELAVTDISYGAVPTRDVDVSPPAGAKVVDLGSRHVAANQASSTPAVNGLDAVQAAADFPVVAPDTLVGLPRQDVRLVGGDDERSSLYGQGLGGIARRRAQGRRAGARQSALSALPTVSLDGVTAHELATQLGTVLDWQSRRHRATSSPVRSRRGRRGGRASARMSDAPPVEARGLVKRYGEIVAVDHVDLTVERGDVFGYLGPNGAGKTTSLRMLLGLIRPTEGSARLFGRDPLVDGAKALDGVAGFVEGPRFYPYLSGRRNLELLADYDGGGAALADRGGARDRRAARPSQGSRRRLLARDAPAARHRRVAAAAPAAAAARRADHGLDPAGMRDMRDLVRRLAAEGITILLSSHLLAEVEELCNRVAIIRKGRIIYEGALDELLATATTGVPAARRRAGARASASCLAQPGVEDVTLRDDELRFPADEDDRGRADGRARPGARRVHRAGSGDGKPRGALPRHDRRRLRRSRRTRRRSRMSATAHVYRWEIAKLLAQKRTYLGLGAAIVVPIIFVVVLKLQTGGPNDVPLGRYIRDTGLAAPVRRPLLHVDLGTAADHRARRRRHRRVGESQRNAEDDPHAFARPRRDLRRQGAGRRRRTRSRS